MPGVNYIGGRAYLIVAVQGNQNTIELLRLEPNGTVEQRVLSYKPDSNLGDTSNPPLRDGDGVVVDPHGWAKTNDRLKAAVRWSRSYLY